MKLKIGFLLFAFLLVFSCSNTKNEITENEEDGKIKVYLLGTFHFAQTDSTYNILDEKHQKSIQKLNDIIVGLNPNKIFIERMPDFEYQNKIDSLYIAYISREKETYNPNEIWQVAFKVGKRLGHKKLYQCDHSGMYGANYSKMLQYAKKYNQMDILDENTKGTIKIRRKINRDSIRNSKTLLEYVKWLNSRDVQYYSHAYYITVPPQVGHTDVYKYKKNEYLLGTELTADWYRRNIYIYSKIINQLDYNERAIFLLMGNDHIPIIKHLFEGNPYFKVMDTEKWLN